MDKIGEIIYKTSRVVPTAFDMGGRNFDSGCHMEVTDRTFESVSREFGVGLEEAREMVEGYLNSK